MVTNIYQTTLKDTTKPELILDLGANVGLEYRKLLDVFPNSKVISVEPVTSNVLELYKKITDGQLESRWFVEHCAVDLKENFVELGYEKNRSMSGHANGSLDKFNWGNWHYSYRQQCRTKPLSQICSSPTIVKVDIERHEYIILPEIVKISSVKAIFLELHGYCKPLNTEQWINDLCQKYNFTAKWYRCNQSQTTAFDSYEETAPIAEIPCGLWAYVTLVRNE